MIKLFNDQKENIFKVQKELGMDKMRLYRYAKGKISIDEMPIKLFFSICSYFNMKPFDLYEKIKKYQEEENNEKEKKD